MKKCSLFSINLYNHLIFAKKQVVEGYKTRFIFSMQRLVASLYVS